MDKGRRPTDWPIATFACLLAVSLALIALALAADPLGDMSAGSGDFWGFVALIFFALMSATASVAMFLGKDWGRAVLSGVLDCLALVVISLGVIYVRGESYDLPGLLLNLGLWLAPIGALLALIVILHGRGYRSRRLRKANGVGSQVSENHVPEAE